MPHSNLARSALRRARVPDCYCTIPSSQCQDERGREILCSTVSSWIPYLCDPIFPLSFAVLCYCTRHYYAVLGPLPLSLSLLSRLKPGQDPSSAVLYYILVRNMYMETSPRRAPIPSQPPLRHAAFPCRLFAVEKTAKSRTLDELCIRKQIWVINYQTKGECQR